MKTLAETLDLMQLCMHENRQNNVAHLVCQFFSRSTEPEPSNNSIMADAIEFLKKNGWAVKLIDVGDDVNVSMEISCTSPTLKSNYRSHRSYNVDRGIWTESAMMLFRTKISMGIKNGDEEKLAKLICSAFDSFNPIDYKKFYCCKSIKDATLFLKSKGWRVKLLNIGSDSKPNIQVACITPDRKQSFLSAYPR